MESDRFALSGPIDTPETPAVEIVSRTRRDEARSAMAVVAALRERDVPIRDVAVVVRDLDPNEEPLFRAALQYGIAPVFWTQLRVTQTRPYALIESVCAVLAQDRVGRDTLLRPLELRWSPVDSTAEAWPIEPEEVHRAKTELPASPRSVSEWIEAIRSTDTVDERLRTFGDWIDSAPRPEPESVVSLLDEVVSAYAERGLPETMAADSPALLDTETDARAVVRVRTLVQQLRHKFADRLEAGTMERSWNDVAELAGVIATQRPGRREHSNARALDIFEANDIWALEIPFVIAVGMTETEWPQPSQSALPAAFQEAILRGEGESETLAPQPAWAGGRDRDQFVDTLQSAGQCLVVTRHTHTVDGDEVPPSPLLEHLDTQCISEASRRQLISPDRALPPEMRGFVVEASEGNDE
jgi:ATP-dependent helicase/nuclease subunit B